MSPDQLAAIRPIYRNPERSASTCPVCTTPLLAGDSLCIPCSGHMLRGLPLADLVAPLTYAEKRTQAYQDLYSYKEPPATPQTDAAEGRLRYLLYAMLSQHISCIAPSGLSAIAHVPSSKGRIGPHPLSSMLTLFRAEIPRLEIAFSTTPEESSNDRRALRPERVLLPADLPSDLGTVLLIEDAWVTGGHAQSIASRLKQAGAGQVVVVALARVLDPNFSATDGYLRAHPRAPFDPELCPVHGVKHPSGS